MLINIVYLVIAGNLSTTVIPQANMQQCQANKVIYDKIYRDVRCTPGVIYSEKK